MTKRSNGGGKKRKLSDLAIFGGESLFERPRPIGQLAPVDVDQFLETFRTSYDARYLTNDGPLVGRLESNLTALHSVSHCICVANAALGITMLLQIFGKEKGEVIMPAFSYRGLPHFARWAGQRPVFCDVDPVKHTLDPNDAKDRLTENTASILTVANFNSVGQIDALSSLAHSNQLPIFIDSVYAIGSTYGGRMLGGFTDAEVYSLHATKLVNGFEGGYITTDDDNLAAHLRWQRNFALSAFSPKNKESKRLIGLNAKLNEMHAAMALCSVEQLDRIISRNRSRFEAYCNGLSAIEGLQVLACADNERHNYQMVVVEVTKTWLLSRDETVSLLRAEGATISAYYSPPLHLSEHCPPGLTVPNLPVSEELATKFLQLPVGDLVSAEDIDRLCELLVFVQEHGDAIRKRIESDSKE